MESRITIAEVAKHAGVSLGSASRALNRNGASPTMVERVEAAARELGYFPDAIGRSLRTKRTLQIAFAVADIGNPVYVEMLSTIHAMLEPHGYRVVVMSTGTSTQNTCELLAGLDQGFIDGVIVSPLRLNERVVETIQGLRVPVVVIGRPLCERGIDSVSTDSARGVGLAVEHVLNRGARNVVLLNGPHDTTPGMSRSRGFRDALVGSAKQCTGEEVSARDFTVKDGEEAAMELLGRQVPDAIIAANDLLAVGAIKAAHRCQVMVPEMMMVTGMDDTDLAAYFEPAITSVSLGSAQRAEAAASMLMRRIQGDVSTPNCIEVGADLIERSSTKR